MRLKFAVATTLCGLALIGASCDEAPSQEDDVREAISNYYYEMFEGNSRMAYLMLDSETKKTCTPEYWSRLTFFFKSPKRSIPSKWYVKRIEDIRVEGSVAYAKVYIGIRETVRYYDPPPPDSLLKRENGRWYLSEGPCDPDRI